MRIEELVGSFRDDKDMVLVQKINSVISEHVSG